MNEAMRSVSRLRENKIFVSDVCELSSAADNVQQNAVLSEESCSLGCAGTERSVSSPPPGLSAGSGSLNTGCLRHFAAGRGGSPAPVGRLQLSWAPAGGSAAGFLSVVLESRPSLSGVLNGSVCCCRLADSAPCVRLGSAPLSGS